MNLSTPSAVRCAMQIALLGAITPNLRSVKVSFSDKNAEIYFYYDQPPSENEEELSEEVSTEFICFYSNVSADVKRVVLPYPKRLPQDNEKLGIYSRWEKTPPEL